MLEITVNSQMSRHSLHPLLSVQEITSQQNW